MNPYGLKHNAHFENIIKIFFHLTIFEFLDLFIFMPRENRWMTRYNLSSGRVTKQTKLSSYYQGRMSTKQSFYIF